MIVYGDQDYDFQNNISFGQYMLEQIRLFAAEDDVCVENGMTGETLTYKEAIQYIEKLTVGLSKLGVKTGEVVAIGSDMFLNYIPVTLAATATGAAVTFYELDIGEGKWNNKRDIEIQGTDSIRSECSSWPSKARSQKRRCGSDWVRTFPARHSYNSGNHNDWSNFHLFRSGQWRRIIKHKLQLTKPTHLICSSQFWNAYQNLLKSFDCIKTYIALSDIPEMSSLISLTDVDVDVENFKPRTSQDTDTALILYSSGTTAMPKGVELTHYCCIARCHLIKINVPCERALFLSPSSGSFVVFGTSEFLLEGRRIVFTSDRSTKTLLSVIRNCKVDIILSNPVHIRDIAKCGLRQDHMDSVKWFVCGGFNCSADMIQLFKESFPHVEKIVQIYGMTECAGCSELCAPACRPGSVGYVFHGHVVKVVDPNTQAVLGPNQHGEIRLKGSDLMKGYIDINSSTYMDEDGFFKSGDIGYFDDDQYFYVVDRMKDFIFGKFAKVSPLEIEHILLQHPAVLDVGVVGKPDPVLNEVPAAFIVKKPGCDVSDSELMDFVASKASLHMHMKGGVRFVQEIPRNNTGKTLRRQLKVMLEESE